MTRARVGKTCQLVTMLAAASGATGVGIEGDPAAADLASATLHAHGVATRAHVITSDARSVIGGGAAAIGGPVDLALLANVIYYIAPKERTALLSRIAGLLNPRGPCSSSPRLRVRGLRADTSTCCSEHRTRAWSCRASQN